MASDGSISHCTKATQERIFRIAQRDGLTLKAISLDSGIPYSTLRSYAGHNGETAEMPVSALYKLVGVIPDELLSLLLPEGRMILAVRQDVDHYEAAKAMHDYLECKDGAHHPDSECGPAIGPGEDQTLRAKLTVIQGSAAA
jgi:hypothetical protein